METRRPGRAPMLLLICLLVPWSPAGQLFGSSEKRVAVVLTGLGGLPEYSENFNRWAESLGRHFREELEAEVYFVDGSVEPREAILGMFNRLAGELPERSEVWLFLIGHANYDGVQFRFNIRGPDLTGGDLDAFLSTLGERRQIVVLATSAAGVLLDRLSGPNRIVVSATRSERERQPPRFMEFFVEATASPEADMNRDGRISLLEAFLFSRRGVAHWFEERGQIQTEHPILDDRAAFRLTESKEDGDALSSGTGLLAAATYLSVPSQEAYRSLEARELALERESVEREIEELKLRRRELSEEDYYGELELLLVRLARISEEIRRLEAPPE